MSERALSRLVLAECGALPGVLLGHNPVGEARYIVERTGRGYVVPYGWPAPGGPDLIAVVRSRAGIGRFLGLELKSETGVSSGAQRACHRAIEAAGGLVRVVRSVEEARRAIEEARR